MGCVSAAAVLTQGWEPPAGSKLPASECSDGPRGSVPGPSVTSHSRSEQPVCVHHTWGLSQVAGRAQSSVSLGTVPVVQGVTIVALPCFPDGSASQVSL